MTTATVTFKVGDSVKYYDSVKGVVSVSIIEFRYNGQTAFVNEVTKCGDGGEFSSQYVIDVLRLFR